MATASSWISMSSWWLTKLILPSMAGEVKDGDFIKRERRDRITASHSSTDDVEAVPIWNSFVAIPGEWWLLAINITPSSCRKVKTEKVRVKFVPRSTGENVQVPFWRQNHALPIAWQRKRPISLISLTLRIGVNFFPCFIFQVANVKFIAVALSKWDTRTTEHDHTTSVKKNATRRDLRGTRAICLEVFPGLSAEVKSP